MKKIKVICFFVCLLVLIISLYNIYNYVKQATKSENINKKLVNKAVTIINKEERKEKECPISVDFQELKKESENIVAWIYCEDTPINYPIVKGKDNFYYLNHLTNDEVNEYGSVFLDYRNSGDFSDNEIIVYGHNMKNDTMFGTIMNYKNRDYYENHKKMYLCTLINNFEIELLAGDTISSESKIYNLNNRNEILKSVNENSKFNNEINVSDDDKLVVLSTCTNEVDEERYILIGRLKNI